MTLREQRGGVRYASLSYADSGNLGDNIQTLATEQHLPHVDRRIDRDTLAEFNADKPHLIILNGWFSRFPEQFFPPSDDIIPVFVGFHIAEFSDSRTAHFFTDTSLSYFRRHQPIGCRDDGTRLMLEEAGVQAFTSYCLTLTFPTRTRAPKDGRVFIVDGDRLPVPLALRAGSVRLSHDVSDVLGDDIKTAMARRLLDAYRDRARLVITSRLHCALPCLAMGIPVIFFGDATQERVRFAQELGLKIHPIPRDGYLSQLVRITPVIRRIWNWWRCRSIDWGPGPVNIDAAKALLAKTVAEAIASGERRYEQSGGMHACS